MAGTDGETDAWGTGRRSRLFPDGGMLVHADLHNHTLLSDGSGDPRELFGSLRRAGLDAAAITDHVTVGSPLARAVPRRLRRRMTGISPQAWELAAMLADAADEPGSFVAIRGFEWSHPLHGHVNVWDSARFTDPLVTGALGMRRLYAWLCREGAGDDGVAGFNHPGVGGGARFDGFRHEPAGRGRIVSVEVFNKLDDYLHRGTRDGGRSPLVHCLDAGWRVALIGVTDEHGTNWGTPEHKGRAGLYVDELTRAGVRAALSARRAFASRVKGLRVDAAAGGVRMGGTLPRRRGRLRVEVDLDRGASWHGRRLNVQLLRPGSPLPMLAAAVEVRVPRPDEPVIAVEADADPDDGEWLVLRVSDPDRPPDPRAGPPFAELGHAIAYASPWWFADSP